MQLGLIGLGRMGFNMRERLRAAGHEVIGYDHHPDVTDVSSLKELVEKLAAPRVVWIMVPVQYTEPTIDELAAATLRRLEGFQPAHASAALRGCHRPALLQHLFRDSVERPHAHRHAPLALPA